MISEIQMESYHDFYELFHTGFTISAAQTMEHVIIHQIHAFMHAGYDESVPPLFARQTLIMVQL